MGNIETVKKMYELFASKDNNAIRQIFDENIINITEFPIQP
ncbi:MAG: hypothetical protein NVV82_19860 [Sporocytophaga sp.]|nr:hypothetical protein [Sporocytophaga sp.]